MDISPISERRKAVGEDYDLDIDLAVDYNPDVKDEDRNEENGYEYIQDMKADTMSPVRQDDQILEDNTPDDQTSAMQEHLARDDDIFELEDDYEIDITEPAAKEQQNAFSHEGNGTQDKECTVDRFEERSIEFYSDVEPIFKDANFDLFDDSAQHLDPAKEHFDDNELSPATDNLQRELRVENRADRKSASSEPKDVLSDTDTNSPHQDPPIDPYSLSARGDGYNDNSLVYQVIKEIDGPYVHPVVVRYSGVEIALFPPAEHLQGDMDYFLRDESYVTECFAELLSAMRSVIASEITEQDELELGIEVLGLAVCEVSLP